MDKNEFPAYIQTRPNLIFNSSRRQKFSVPCDVINYILKNLLKPQIYFMLLKTCKHFHSYDNIFLMDAIEARKNTYLFKTDILTNLWIKFPNSLLIEDQEKIPKILRNRCFFKFTSLHISDISLSLYEFYCLIENQKIKEFHLENTSINWDNSIVSMDIIFQSLTYVIDFVYIPQFQSQIDNSLKIINSTYKTYKLKFCQIQCDFWSKEKDPQLLCNFIKNHADYDSIFSFHFAHYSSKKYIKNFRKELKKMEFFLNENEIMIEIFPNIKQKSVLNCFGVF